MTRGTDTADAVVDADAELVEGHRAPSERIPLDRGRIVTAAISYIDESGLAGLSMRKLGGLLGVEAMSLYRHVPGKEDLLDAIVEAVIDELDADEKVLSSPEDGWQDFVQRIAHGLRRVALAHPKVFPLVASRPPEAPWLRPPIRTIGWVESFLDAMISEGFSDEAAVAAYRAFSSFLLGNLLLEVSTHGAEVGPLDVYSETDDPSSSHLREFPTVRRLQSSLAQDNSAMEFEDGLEELINRLTVMRAEIS